jgi:hypothetical protein
MLPHSGAGRITSQFKTSSYEQESFLRRSRRPPECAHLGRAAEDLRAILAIVEAEAKAMAEAQQRFVAKKPTKRSAKSNRAAVGSKARSPTERGLWRVREVGQMAAVPQTAT